jgi:aspartate dehydrogenase
MDIARASLCIIGAGCIGRRVAQAAAQGEIPYTVTAVHDTDTDAAARLIADFAPQAQALDLAGALAAAEVVLEAAAGAAVPGIVAAAQASHARCGAPQHLLLMSVGGLLDVALPPLAPPVLHVPSGAIGALDAIQALAVAGLDEVRLTTRKPPAGLGGEVAGETVLFEGPAREVIAKFPKNVNVAIALSLAGIGPDRTMVRLIADPAVDRNTHQIYARGAAGEIEFTSRNVPFPENPRTSYLAALSAIALLRRLAGNLQVG